jgi:hypothetical protein
MVVAFFLLVAKKDASLSLFQASITANKPFAASYHKEAGIPHEFLPLYFDNSTKLTYNGSSMERNPYGGSS